MASGIERSGPWDYVITYGIAALYCVAIAGGLWATAWVIYDLLTRQ